jgi:hypothetical protein
LRQPVKARHFSNAATLADCVFSTFECRRLRLGRVKMLLQRLAVRSVAVLEGRALRREFADLGKRVSNMKAMVPVELVRLQFDVAALLEGVASGPCGSIMLCRLMPPGTKPSGLAS